MPYTKLIRSSYRAAKFWKVWIIVVGTLLVLNTIAAVVITVTAAGSPLVWWINSATFSIQVALGVLNRRTSLSSAVFAEGRQRDHEKSMETLRAINEDLRKHVTDGWDDDPRLEVSA